jgi:hypothetical protein
MPGGAPLRPLNEHSLDAESDEPRTEVRDIPPRRAEDQQEGNAEGHAQEPEADRLCVVPNDAAMLDGAF